MAFRERRFLWLLAAAAAALMLCFIVVALSPSTLDAKFERLNWHMTRAQVEAILGPPRAKVGHATDVVPWPVAGRIESTPPVEVGLMDVMVWTKGPTTLTVGFGANNDEHHGLLVRWAMHRSGTPGTLWLARRAFEELFGSSSRPAQVSTR